MTAATCQVTLPPTAEQKAPSYTTKPARNMEVLNQEIEMGSDEGDFASPERAGRYRLRVGDRIRYLVIKTDVFDEDTMTMPSLLLPRLPALPDGPWNTMHISKSADGSMQTSLSTEPLRGVEECWHPLTVDVLPLPETRKLKSEVYETLYEGGRCVAKVASFDWQITYVDHETFIYSLINRGRDAGKYTPAFVAHLHEEGRAMGMLLEFVEGRHATPNELEECEEALRWLHEIGIVHGDVNRNNFLVDPVGSVRMIDFAHSKPWSEEAAKQELEDLRTELSDTSARGAPRTNEPMT